MELKRIMSTIQFIRSTFAPAARITIFEHESGDTWYEGDVMSLRLSMVAGTTIVSVSLGKDNSIVIGINDYGAERKYYGPETN